jgi:N-acetylmuramic acid 6-phosphate etherase
MVDVRATNAKLVERSENILRRLSGRSSGEARDALARAGGNIKVAMLLLEGCSVAKANELLEQAGGRLRAAIRLAGSGGAVASNTLTVAADIPSTVRDNASEK